VIKNHNADTDENIKPLGELCNFRPGKQLSKSNFKTGIYNVIGGGKKPVRLHNEFNKNKNTILCSSSGSAGLISKYKDEVWASDCFSIHSNNNEVLNEEYLYFYLKNIQESIYKLQTGVAQPHTYPKTIRSLQIPLLPIKEQMNIVKLYKKHRIKIDKLESEIKELKEFEKNYISNKLRLKNRNINDSIDEIEEVVTSIEEKIIIKPKTKVKKIIKKIEKPLIIIKKNNKK